MPAVKKPAAPKRATLAKIRSTVLPEEEVFVAEYDGTVLVRGLSFKAELAAAEEAAESGHDFNAIVLKQCIIEPEITIEDAEAILDAPARIGTALIEAVNRVNGEGASEEALKTFPAGAPE